MRPVRYLLREAVLRDFLKDRPPGHFFELGYGAGFTLQTLAAMGFTGEGYDRSPDARREATALLKEAHVRGVELLDEMPTEPRFDYVVLLEVIGYMADPVAELRRLRALLRPNGRILLSFNGKNAAYSRNVDSDIAKFSRQEMIGLVEAGGFTAATVHNYGYPLTNVMRPVLNVYQSLRRVKPDVGTTGLHHKAPLISAVGRIFDGKALAPFVHAQRFFRDGERGNGYVVMARAK